MAYQVTALVLYFAKSWFHVVQVKIADVKYERCFLGFVSTSRDFSWEHSFTGYKKARNFFEGAAIEPPRILNL